MSMGGGESFTPTAMSGVLCVYQVPCLHVTYFTWSLPETPRTDYCYHSCLMSEEAHKGMSLAQGYPR
jgi:hypothetical protein